MSWTQLGQLVTISSILVSRIVLAAEPLPLYQRIDQAIAASHAGPLAARADDDQFLRRVYLDLAGRIPSRHELQQFRSNTSANKRGELIDALLASDESNAHLAIVFDVMLMERRPDVHVATDEWRRYLARAFAASKPFNQLTAEVLSASGDEGDGRAAGKFLLDRDVESHAITRDVSRMFLGRDIQCSQCHDHPLIDDYSQADYYGVMSFLSRSFRFEKTKSDNQKVSLIGERAEGDLTFASVFEPDAAKVTALPALPDGIGYDQDVVPAPDDAYVVAPDQNERPVPRYSRRARLAELAADGRSDLFRTNIANRLWRILMKRGLVEPPDLIHSGNPASYPQLLDELASAIGAMNYDVKEFLRQVARSEAYQRGIVIPETLLDSATESAEQLPKLTEQLDYQQQVVERAATDMQRAAADLQSSRAGIVQVRAEIAGALQERDQAAKQQQESAGKRPEVEQRRAERAAQAESLRLAAEHAQAAAQRRADDQQLAAAAQLLVERSAGAQQELAAVDQELAAIDAAVAQAEQQRTAAADRLPPLRQTHEERIARAKEDAGGLRAALAGLHREQAVAVNLRHQLRLAQQTTDLRDAEQKLVALSQTADAPAAERDAAEVQRNLCRDRLRTSLAERFVVGSPLALSPEQLAASVVCALNLQPRFQAEAEAQWRDQNKDKPENEIDPAVRAQQIVTLVEQRRREVIVSFVSFFAGTPGSPQDSFFSTVDQALFLANDGRMQSWLEPAHDNLTAQLLAATGDDDLARQLYESVLGREPTEHERGVVSGFVQASADNRQAAIQDMIWGLLTSVEFRFNH